MNELSGGQRHQILQEYATAPMRGGKNETGSALLGFITGTDGKKSARIELRKAHEQAFGEAPNAFEEWCYGWLTLKGIEAKIIELNQKSEANKTAQ